MAQDHSPATVLVVDDDRDVLEAVALTLESAGYPVLLATNGEEALTRLREHHPDVAVVLLDLMMPVMDGWQFRAVQQGDPDLAAVPIVVFSADGRVADKARSIGVTEYLLKTAGADALLAMIGRYCRRAGG
jgi:CheY-like chemotaxis protein